VVRGLPLKIVTDSIFRKELLFLLQSGRNVRKDVLDKNPEIADLLSPLSIYLSEPIMIRLSYLVDAEDLEPDEVSRNSLRAWFD